jgi:hypothetical protein
MMCQLGSKEGRRDDEHEEKIHENEAKFPKDEGESNL